MKGYKTRHDELSLPLWAQRRLAGQRSALQRALPEIRRWRDVGHHTGEDKARLGELIADCEAAREET